MKKKILQVLSVFLILITPALYAQKTISTNNYLVPAKEKLQKNSAESSIRESGWYNEAISNIDLLQYQFKKQNTGNTYTVINLKNNIESSISVEKYYIKNLVPLKQSSNWKTSFTFLNISRNERKWELKPISTTLNGSNLQFKNQHFDVEYLNDSKGLRQNFIIKDRQAGDGEIALNLELGGDMTYKLQDNKLVCFNDYSHNKTSQLIYDDLKVWDANGNVMPARMNLKDNILSLVINDKNAVYPITVDPLNHTPEWTSSADGVLPSLLTNLQLQIDAIHGYNVAALGDVNGDGFDDVAIGAPGAIDIIAGPSTIVGAGAVYVYFGSSSGLPAMPSKVLRATTPVTNALFGFSIAGGNVTGNSQNDIIIGAPGETYTASVSGVPVTASVTAGKVYVFRGEDMAATNPTPLLSIYLNGSIYFSNGIIGTAANVSINALFGYSVAVSEDMNGDGLGEVIVGAPGYASLGLLPVRSGAALVYYSTALVTNAAVKLQAPTSALLGIPLLNNDGLLFGLSVDGLGDYNKDGKPDIVVGAPGGVSLPLSNFLGGSAYVYNGNGSGVNTAIGTMLTASPSLINTIANLFGYYVKGVTNASGARNGNILIGAPNSNILSNIVSGLRLRSGNVDLFKAKITPGSSQLPDQQLPSPRASSLLSILAGQNINVSSLFGASIDNMLDVNCDGISDIIVGEPLSTSVGIISANAVGGNASVYLGKADGTYNTSAFWSLQNVTSFAFGVNAGSLLGYSVAGARHIRGAMQGVRALIGAPGAAFDFGTGIFNFGNTFGTLFGFVAGNNGLGKAYLYGFNDCGVIYNPDVNVTFVNVSVAGNVSTNDKVPVGSSYGTPVANVSNPAIASIVMFPDGSYTFNTSVAGVYLYDVPVCLPGGAAPCTLIQLKITVLTTNSAGNPPVANTDVASTKIGAAVVIRSLDNDRCSNTSCSLNPSSVTVITPPMNGIAIANGSTGDIIYLPNSGFTGNDTLYYQVCDNGSPAKCATAMQIITVYASASENTTLAADDYETTVASTPVSGNVRTNDTDPEGDNQVITVQSVTISNTGHLDLSANGTFIFTPFAGFTGPVEFTYTTCDDGTPSVCASATLHILVRPVLFLPVSLRSFDISTKDCGVQLSWSSANQLNMDHFEVEQSMDALTWTTVTNVQANTNSSLAADYSYKVSNPDAGLNYFRLKIMEKDQAFHYSNILNANITCKVNSIKTGPNPFIKKIIIQFNSERSGVANISLSDITGKRVMNKSVAIQKGYNNITLDDLSGLSSGLYVVKLKTNNIQYVSKLVK